MSTPRTYSDACGMAHGLDLVGGRWALHVVRELVLGPKRYSDLQADLPGISTSMLRDRLVELERDGLVRRRRLDPPAASWVYELTGWGRELGPVVCALGRWAARSPGHRPDLPLSTTAFVLSLRTNVDAARTAGRSGSWSLRVGSTELHAWLADGAFTVEPGDASGEAPARLVGAPEQLAGLVYGGRDLDEAAASGDVAVEGDRDALRVLLELFTLPEKAPVPG